MFNKTIAVQGKYYKTTQPICIYAMYGAHVA